VIVWVVETDGDGTLAGETLVCLNASCVGDNNLDPTPEDRGWVPDLLRAAVFGMLSPRTCTCSSGQVFCLGGGIMIAQGSDLLWEHASDN
jgi:hypothetical protein